MWLSFEPSQQSRFCRYLICTSCSMLQSRRVLWYSPNRSLATELKICLFCEEPADTSRPSVKPHDSLMRRRNRDNKTNLPIDAPQSSLIAIVDIRFTESIHFSQWFNPNYRTSVNEFRVRRPVSIVRVWFKPPAFSLRYSTMSESISSRPKYSSGTASSSLSVSSR